MRELRIGGGEIRFDDLRVFTNNEKLTVLDIGNIGRNGTYICLSGYDGLKELVNLEDVLLCGLESEELIVTNPKLKKLSIYGGKCKKIIVDSPAVETVNVFDNEYISELSFTENCTSINKILVSDSEQLIVSEIKGIDVLSVDESEEYSHIFVYEVRSKYRE